MKQTFRLLLLAGIGTGWLGVACQPQSKPTAAVDASQPSASKTTTPANTTHNEPPAASTASTQNAAPLANVPAFLASHNLAPLWQADFSQHETGSSWPTILDGFYGAEHRHIAVIFDRVEQDAARPNVYRVHGRTRFRKNITPFAGTITMEGIKTLPNTSLTDLDSAAQAQAHVYSATGRFVLREDSTAAGSGIFRGTAMMDFYQLASGKLDIMSEMPDHDLPCGGGGQLFRGQWTSFRTGRQQEVAFATYAQAVLPDAMADLYIGDRDATLNPKYAKLDWSEAWANEEWWAKSPKPKLNL